MIKAVYGEAIYHMLRAVAGTCSESPKVMECNTRLSEKQVAEYVKNYAFVIPYCSAVYIVDPKVKSFQIQRSDGQTDVYSFDMLNTMPIHLCIELRLFAATQEQLSGIEKTVRFFFSEPKELIVTDFPGYNGRFIESLGINPKVEKQNVVGFSDPESGQFFRTQISLVANCCVAPYLPIAQDKINQDISFQHQLLGRLYALNAIHRVFGKCLDKPKNYTADEVVYMWEAVRNVSLAREKIKAAIRIPEAYNNVEYSKLLQAMMGRYNVSVEEALKKLRHTRNPNDSLHPGVRKQLLRDVKQALDIEQTINEYSDLRRQLLVAQFSKAPAAPEKPEKEDFTDDALRYPDVHRWKKEERKRASAFSSDGFMGMQGLPREEPQLSAQGEALYRQALADFEQKEKVYCEVLLPGYENKKAEWETTRLESLKMVELVLHEVMRQRLPHYEEIGFLPLALQNLNTISFVHQQLSDTNLPLQQILRNANPLGSRSGQILAIKTALDLSVIIEDVREKINSEKNRGYVPRPTAPVKQNVPAPVYPKIKTNVQFFDTNRLTNALFNGGNYFADHKKEVQAEEERIRNSPEYKQQCAAITEEYRRKVAAAEEDYRTKLKYYHEVVLPPYEKGLAAWKKWHEKALVELETKLERLEKELAAYYEATKIVPMQYRQIDALEHIHNVMRTSNYSVVQAIQNYDMEIQRQIAQRRLEEQQRQADYAQQAAWDARQAADAAEKAGQNAAPSDNRRDYYMTSNCLRRTKFKLIHGCQGCPMAHVCSSYR